MNIQLIEHAASSVQIIKLTSSIWILTIEITALTYLVTVEHFNCDSIEMLAFHFKVCHFSNGL